jgi:hypothetical protein
VTLPVTMSFAPTFYPPNVAASQRAAAVKKSRRKDSSGYRRPITILPMAVA